MKRKFVSLILIFVGGIAFAPAVFGQTGLGISPLTFELSGSPGEVIENFIKVYNPTDNVIGIRMQIQDIAPAGEEGFITVEPAETETYSLASWIKTEPTELDLQPKEEKYVKFTLTIPENAEPGGHYGTVLASTISISGPEATGALIIPRIGSLVLLTIPGAMKENLIVKDFSLPHRYFSQGPITFSIKLENKGTVHVKPTGYVTITNWLDKKVADIALSSQNVLPGAVRKFDVTFNKKWLWAGKYTATLSGSYGMSNRAFTPVVITFWAFPWKAAIVILLVLILLILTRRRWLVAFSVLVRGEKALRRK